MRTQRLSSTLHLGTLHDVFVQMISLACRQPNYLSSSVSSRSKITSPRLCVRGRTHSLARTHTRAHKHATGPSECHSAPAVSWKLLLCRSVLKFRGLIVLGGEAAVFSGVLILCLCCLLFFFFFNTASKNTHRVGCFHVIYVVIADWRLQ